MIGDLRYVDPTSLTGANETRLILSNIGTPEPVIDWVLDTVREYNDRLRDTEKEVARVMDMVE